MTRYIEWDFDRMIATLYEREGECNNCGRCCGDSIYYAFQYPDDADVNDINMYLGGGDRTDLKGIWQEVIYNNKRLFRKFIKYEQDGKICRHRVNGLCNIHDEQEPIFCLLWPISPTEVALFPECSYRFIKIKERSFEINK